MNTAPFFEHYYNNAEVNCIMIMDCDGQVLDVNKAFTNNFGYTNEDITGQNFNILFNELDKQNNKPQLELKSVLTKGQGHDDNYVINKAGLPVWCTGESLLVKSKEGEKYIVKHIVNLQAKKHVQLFLTDTEELLEKIFDSSTDIAMIILDGGMKIIKANESFLQLFDIEEAPLPGSRLSDLDHTFWNSAQMRQEMSAVIVNHRPLKGKDFLLQNQNGEQKTVRLDSKIIDRQNDTGRKIFIIIEEITPQ